MQSQAILPKFNLSELCFQVWQVGHISQTHRQQLRSALLGEFLTEQDYRLIDRLLYAIRRGWLPVLD